MCAGRVGLITVGLWLALSLVPWAATAQTVTEFSDLPLRLNVGDAVRIEDRGGGRHAGTVVRISPEEIVVNGPEGERRFTAAITARVARRGDPVWTGALIGFVPGFFAGTQFVLGFSDHEEPMSTFLLAGGLFGVAGAGIGAVIDALHQGTREIYRANAARVAVGPLVSRHAVGAAATMRW